MTWVRAGLRRIVGLFVDDPFLAAGAAMWIALIAVLGVSVPGLVFFRAFALVLGLCAVATLSIVRGATTPR